MRKTVDLTGLTTTGTVAFKADSILCGMQAGVVTFLADMEYKVDCVRLFAGELGWQVAVQPLDGNYLITALKD